MADLQGLAFDPVAEDYERARPGWPDGVTAGVEAATVLDLGAGTGKLTRLLLACYPRVIAVEPTEGMRAVLRREAPGAEVAAGSAEEIPLPDGSVDAVFVAEAFHWFDSAAAAREIARVLRPGGACTVCFNAWRTPFRPRLPEEPRRVLRDVFARVGEPGGPKVASGAWRLGFEPAPFGPFEESSLDHVHECDRDGVVSHYLSLSNVARLPPGDRADLRRRLRALLPEVAYRLELTAEVFRARRLPE
jgi:SAM-dependent methyltransferase